jgi:hypothetical protein
LEQLSSRAVWCSSITAIGIAAHGPAAAIIEPLKRALLDANVDTELVIILGPQVAAACVQMFMETGELGDGNEDNPDRRVRHPDQQELDPRHAGEDQLKLGYSDDADNGCPSGLVVLGGPVCVRLAPSTLA